MNDNTISKKDPEELGRRAAARWEPQACPYEPGTSDANEWANGLLAGREAFSWNLRNLFQIGSTARWVSDSVSPEIAQAMAKSIFHIGAESPVFFRLGFILAFVDWPVPIMSLEEWRNLGMVVNRALQGRELADVGLSAEPTWLEQMAFLEARDFMLKIIGHPAPANPKAPGELSFAVDLRLIIPWMGAEPTEQIRQLIPASPPGI